MGPKFLGDAAAAGVGTTHTLLFYKCKTKAQKESVNPLESPDVADPIVG